MARNCAVCSARLWLPRAGWEWEENGVSAGSHEAIEEAMVAPLWTYMVTELYI